MIYVRSAISRATKLAPQLDELVMNSLVMTTEFGYRMLLPIRAVATRMLAGLRNRKALDDAFALRMNALASAAVVADSQRRCRQARLRGSTCATPTSARRSPGRSNVRKTASDRSTTF